MSETVFLILLSLAEGPRHGYAIMQDVEALTDGGVRLSTGTLYGALRRLLAERTIRRYKETQQARDRQAYELTEAGREALSAEVAKMQRFARVAKTRLANGEA
jgi:DNA-binding PadR family transcriptional regulator